VIVASCGCTVPEGQDTVQVEYDTESCDAVDGWGPCTVYASLCPACVPKYREWYPGLKIDTDMTSGGAP
jgi:hypothetical protein